MRWGSSPRRARYGPPEEVSGRDGRHAGLGHPREQRRAVEQLPAVHERGEERVVACEAPGQPRRARRGLGVVRMGRDDDRAELACSGHGRLDAVVDADEGADAERERVRSLVGVEVVPGELEPWNEHQAIPLARTPGFVVELGQVVGEDLRAHAALVALLRLQPRIITSTRVVGDAQDVEAAGAVDVDQLADREGAVAPRRVSVQLGEQRSDAGPHTAIVPVGVACMGAKTADLQGRSGECSRRADSVVADRADELAACSSSSDPRCRADGRACAARRRSVRRGPRPCRRGGRPPSATTWPNRSRSARPSPCWRPRAATRRTASDP